MMRKRFYDDSSINRKTDIFIYGKLYLSTHASSAVNFEELPELSFSNSFPVGDNSPRICSCSGLTGVASIESVLPYSIAIS